MQRDEKKRTGDSQVESKVEEASIILLIQVRTCRTEFAHFHIPLQVALLRTIEGICRGAP